METLLPTLLMTLLIALAILGVSVAMSISAKPKGAVLEFLTSGAPGETVIETRVANACLADAEPNALFRYVMDATGASKGADPALELIRKMSGGLWVGGRVFLTSHRIVFLPNALNRAVHKELPVIAFRLADVTGVATRFGFVTNIADFATPAGLLTVRAYGMKAFAEKVVAAQSGSDANSAD